MGPIVTVVYVMLKSGGGGFSFFRGGGPIYCDEVGFTYVTHYILRGSEGRGVGLGAKSL